MEALTKVLYWISTGLMVPVIIFLIAMFVKAILVLGKFYGDYVNKMRFRKELQTVLAKADKSNIVELIDIDKYKAKSNILPALQQLHLNNQSIPHCEKAIADFEIEADRDLGQSKTLTKIGPMLGLMGTLIPMGPALVGLATGDIASMAQNMQVAFATTVVGILIGAIGFITLQIKQRWYTEDLNQLDFIVELFKNK
ncbi:MAG: MotA/TolQ/ExbB proton channel family protein [Hyphomicrobiales bacterium]